MASVPLSPSSRFDAMPSLGDLADLARLKGKATCKKLQEHASTHEVAQAREQLYSSAAEELREQTQSVDNKITEVMQQMMNILDERESSMVEADVGGGYSDLEHTQQQLEAARSRLNDIQWELHLFTDAFGIFVCSREAASGGEEADRVNNRAGYLLKGDSLINVGQALPSFSSSSSCIPPHSPPPPSQFVANYTAINDLWRRLEH
eukprot:TRINITY_DN1705_c0_g1_i1.p1 TRINITY_DN1705_c0_g1~~TRINITY_DN1705_c0_g1_i1.p1  ORF type:complete len:214 (-),score=72.58 TRINITY_DN1705_c0_g1_i1:313-930(-)